MWGMAGLVDGEVRSSKLKDDPPVSSLTGGVHDNDENLARQSSIPQSPQTASYGQRVRTSAVEGFEDTVDLIVKQHGIADIWPTQTAGDLVAIAARACQAASGGGVPQRDDHKWTELLASTKVFDLPQGSMTLGR